MATSDRNPADPPLPSPLDAPSLSPSSPYHPRPPSSPPPADHCVDGEPGLAGGEGANVEGGGDPAGEGDHKRKLGEGDEDGEASLAKKPKTDREEEEEESSSGLSTGQATLAGDDVSVVSSEGAGYSEDSENEQDLNDGSEGEGDQSYYSDSEDNDDGYYQEVDTLLDEAYTGALDEKHTGALDEEGLVSVRSKTILKVKGHKPLELLPAGWVEVTHDSGMPLYLHRPSRVCTWSRPYFLGEGSARRHKVPLVAIPCLNYQREVEKELNHDDTKQSNQGHAADEDGITSSQAKPAESDGQQRAAGETTTGNGDPQQQLNSEAIKNSKIEVCKDESITPGELRDYLVSRFEFDQIQIKRFQNWADKRRHIKREREKASQLQDRPAFPGSTSVLTLKLPQNSRKGQKDYVLNIKGKTDICILHEYTQKVMRSQPKYLFDVNEDNTYEPFTATVEINGIHYGSGSAQNKKLAKMAAAKASIEILMPQIAAQNSNESEEKKSALGYFDHLEVEDERIYTICQKAGHKTPWQVLQECLKRNHGIGEGQVQFDVKVNKNQKNEYVMICGKYQATGTCKNKKYGKQKGAQKILQMLHPHITTWGSLIRMYGKGVTDQQKEKKKEEKSVIELQRFAKKNGPNQEILNKLQSAMRKIHSQAKNKTEKKDKEQNAGPANKPSDVFTVKM